MEDFEFISNLMIWMETLQAALRTLDLSQNEAWLRGLSSTRSKHFVAGENNIYPG